ncbi:MAG: hypothetical protein PSV23_11380 [Brevundimonas sp.]|uniref:hypothetical protein n=1 Tax=Brevundimonas sp. TaxID=1871086 RepID=UPI0024884017|nr:hypothetical protein [Brevundimonas sp.]MDI1327387.1 hypothetical protein [Brevundimonas sp.]
MKQLAVLAAAFALSACATVPAPAPQQDAFMASLNALCGQRFEGRVVSTDAADANFARSRLVMHVRDCSPDEVRIPFHVGDDTSRTWVISRNEEGGLTLKHDHRDPEGRPDGLHWYGGDTTSAGTANRQEFPVDAFSIELFTAGDAAVSTTNVWAVEVHPGRTFAYELRRANRHFRVEFDLTDPLIQVAR